MTTGTVIRTTKTTPMTTETTTVTRRGPGTRRSRIVVAGLGNFLLRDDGIGVHAIQALQELLPRGVCTIEVGSAVLDALRLFERTDRILAIDAMRAGGRPGTIYRFVVKDVDDRTIKTSLHEMELLEALKLLKNGHRPAIAVLGVEPEMIDSGTDLSPSVQTALPQVVAAAEYIVGRWHASPIPMAPTLAE
jgi:hydrogenase maturation protease